MPSSYRTGKVSLSCRWMLLTNPPCKHITILPFPAKIRDRELGNLVALREYERQSEVIELYNENGVKARDVLGQLEQCRGVLRSSMSFYIRLHGVVAVLENDCIELQQATEEQEQVLIDESMRSAAKLNYPGGTTVGSLDDTPVPDDNLLVVDGVAR